MTMYSIGDVADLRGLHWSSDWNSDEILGEDCSQEFVIGLYHEKEQHEGKDVSYYIDLRDSTVMTIFLEDEKEEDIETIWNEEYFI